MRRVLEKQRAFSTPCKAVELTVENPFQLALYAKEKESELDILYRDEANRQVQHSGTKQLLRSGLTTEDCRKFRPLW